MNNVKIYKMDVTELEDSGKFEAYYREMSAERRRKIDRCRRAGAKRLSLGAGILLDRGLSEFGLREKSVKILQGENGKPYLADYPDIRFNLSHSNRLVLAVFAEKEVGCDIELIDRQNLKLAKRFFCPSEYGHLLHQTDEEQQRQEFFRLWTLKESFLKVTGKGMKVPLNSFCFLFENEVRVRQQIDTAEYQFREMIFERAAEPEREVYRAAVCLRMP